MSSFDLPVRPTQLTGSKPADVTVAAMAAVEVARVMAEAAQMVDEAWKELAGSGKAICFSWHLLVCCLGKAQSQKVAQSHRAPSEQEPVSSARGSRQNVSFPSYSNLFPGKRADNKKEVHAQAMVFPSFFDTELRRIR